MLKLILISIAFVGLAAFLLSFNIIFRKDKGFPKGEIGQNKELKKKGLQCSRGEELRLWKKKDNKIRHECGGECEEITNNLHTK